MLLVIAGLLLGCISPAATPGPKPVPAIPLVDCQLSAPGSSTRLEARCGALTVFENRAARSGRQITLCLAVLPAVSRSPAPDPLFFLTGGPGQAATESYLQMSFAFDKINQQRDIVLVDQRGTGQSHPLRCSTAQTAKREDLSAYSDEEVAAWLEKCLDQLDADPRLYTTSLAMDDLDQVREALGYDQINVYGVSYGTRAALTYLRQHPEHVRAIILDGIVPPDLALGPDVAPDAQRALGLIFGRCAADPACQSKFPNLRAEFNSLLATLEQQPVKVNLAHPITGRATELTLTRAKAAAVVRLLSYAPETAALLPLLIHTTQTTGDYHLLAAQYLLVSEQLADTISNGMAYSVVCAEDVPFFTPAEAARADAGTYLGDSETRQLFKICSIWPRGDIPANAKEPMTSTVPALLLSGEADPVTPPSNGDRVAAAFPHSLHLVAPGQGHNVIYRGCLPKIAAAFIESGAVEGLETGCVQKIQPLPFFLDFTGPSP